MTCVGVCACPYLQLRVFAICYLCYQDWHCLAFKGCMFANDPHDISTHQFEVSITAETKMFATLKLKGMSEIMMPDRGVVLVVS